MSKKEGCVIAPYAVNRSSCFICSFLGNLHKMEIIPTTKVDGTNAQEHFLQFLGLKKVDAGRLHTEKGVDLIRLMNYFSGVCNNLTMMFVI